MLVKLLSHTENPEKLIASAGKLCYSSSTIQDLLNKQTEEETERFINLLNSMGHQSPLEHVSFSFGVEGVSRITEIQLVRHRLASYSIQSGRYVKRDNPEYITPKLIKENELAQNYYEEMIKKNIEDYNQLFLILMLSQIGYSDEYIKSLSTDKKIETINEFKKNNKKTYFRLEKIAIENARYGQFQSIGTKIIFTMNLRTLINFTRHRECSRAQDEIQELAKEVMKIFDEQFPILGKLLGASCRFGKCPEGSKCCGNPKKKKFTVDYKEL